MTLMVAMLLTCTAAYAQPRVESAFTDLANSRSMITKSTVQHDNDKNGVPVSTQIYEFTAQSKADRALVKNFITQCTNARDLATSFIMQQNNPNHSESYRILTAHGNSVLVGDAGYKNLLIYTITDTLHPDYRTCYVMEWTSSNDDAIIHGRVIQSYAMKPSRDNHTRIKPGDISSIQLDGNNVTIYSLDSLERMKFNIQDYMDLARNMERQWDDNEAEEAASLEKSASKWLTKFSIYCDKFDSDKSNGKHTSARQAAMAGEILNLCQHHPQLTQNSLNACLKTLQELKSATTNSIVRAMLDDAATALAQ